MRSILFVYHLVHLNHNDVKRIKLKYGWIDSCIYLGLDSSRHQQINSYSFSHKLAGWNIFLVFWIFDTSICNFPKYFHNSSSSMLPLWLNICKSNENKGNAILSVLQITSSEILGGWLFDMSSAYTFSLSSLYSGFVTVADSEMT